MFESKRRAIYTHVRVMQAVFGLMRQNDHKKFPRAYARDAGGHRAQWRRCSKQGRSRLRMDIGGEASARAVSLGRWTDAPVTKKPTIALMEAPYGSNLHRQALALREAILRKPLGLTLTEEERADDTLRRHFCAIAQGTVVGSISLRPVDSETVQLRQM